MSKPIKIYVPRVPVVPKTSLKLEAFNIRPLSIEGLKGDYAFRLSVTSGDFEPIQTPPFLLESMQGYSTPTLWDGKENLLVRVKSLFFKQWQGGAMPTTFFAGLPMSILMGVFVGWGNTRGTLLKKEGEVYLIFDQNKRDFTLGKPGLEGQDPDIDLGNHFVDSKHASISWDPVNGITVEDLGSTYGTWIWEGKAWEKLVPEEPWPMEPGQRIAFGQVEEQAGEIILNPENTVTLVVLRGKDPNVWQLTKRWEFRPISESEKQVAILSQTQSGSSGKLKALLNKFIDWIARPDSTGYELQSLARELEQEGRVEQARELHKKALRTARKQAKKMIPKGKEGFAATLYEMASLGTKYGEFLKRQNLLEEAAIEFEGAAYVFALLPLSKEAKVLPFWVLGQAHLLYLNLAREAERKGTILAAANYYERAGGAIPWTSGIDGFRSDWEPDRAAIYCLARAALLFKHLGYPFQRDLDRALLSLEKIPDDVKFEESWAEEIRSLISDISNAIQWTPLSMRDLELMIIRYFSSP